MRRITVLLVLVAGLSAPEAQGQGLTLGVSSNGTLYYPGDRLQLSISARNAAGGSTLADFYTGLILPDGVTVATLGPGGTASIGRLSNPAGFVPIARGVSLTGAFNASVDPLFNYVWNGSEPVGSYTIFLVAVRAGGFADNRIDGGDVLALQTGGLAVRRPATLTPEGPPVSVPVTVDGGGTISVTSASGTRYQLAIPPGALVNDATITAAPIRSSTGLPVDELLAGVRFGPEGLQLRHPATLTITMPRAILQLGLIAFTVRDDGMGFTPRPVSISGSTATVMVSHFSSTGFGISRCGPTVTTAAGRDACARLARDLTTAAAIVQEGTGGTPLPVRVLLAAEIANELRTWLNLIVVSGLRDAEDPNNRENATHSFLMIALRELSSIEAIAALAAALDIGDLLETELINVRNRIPNAINVRRAVNNSRCNEARQEASLFVQRILELAGEAEARGLPVEPRMRGVTCLRIRTDITFPTSIPSGGAEIFVDSALGHSDGSPFADLRLALLLHSVEIVDRGLANIALPTGGQGEGGVLLRTRITPRPGIGTLAVEVRVDIPDFGFSDIVRVERTVANQAVIITGREVRASKSLSANAQQSDASVNNLESVALPDQTLSDGGASASIRNVRVRMASTTSVGGLDFDASGSSENTASGGGGGSFAGAVTTLRTEFAISVFETVTCSFEIAVTKNIAGGGVIQQPSIQATVSRQGFGVIFQATTTASGSQTCPPGNYTLFIVANVSANTSQTANISYTGRFSFRQ
jgi:hypothetical protein